ncbi:MAG: (2Fe-2S)-binding protein [Acidimicrobiales bacterium]|nr:(2Fe-2S)-binding protein [Acidimicrobiales bacterium]
MRLTVNGHQHELTVPPRTLLSDLLRHDLGLTGTHVGCEQGACGACTVLWDGRAVRSCLALAAQADGARIETIEGVASPESLHPVQQAMHAEHGLQCGFCTPGVVMSLVAAHRDGLDAEAAERDVLGGHLCRCTGYVNIRAAIATAWADIVEGTHAADGSKGASPEQEGTAR